MEKKRGGLRKGSGRKKIPIEEKVSYIRKTVLFTLEEKKIVNEIVKYSEKKSFSEAIKELALIELKKRKK